MRSFTLYSTQINLALGVFCMVEAGRARHAKYLSNLEILFEFLEPVA